MSQQFSTTFSRTRGEDDLARFDGIESIDGYNVTGGNILVALETKNSTVALNDVGRVEGKTDPLSAVGTIVAKYQDFDGTFNDDIKAPAQRATNPLDIGGMRVVENGGFSYDAPIVISSDWAAGQQSKMVDRIFTSNPAILNVDNNESKQTTFDFLTSVSRNILIKIQGDIISGTPTLSYALRGSNTGDQDDFTDVETGTLTDGVFLQTQNIASFQFYQIKLTALSTETLSVNFLIYAFSSMISPTILSSDWSAPEQAKMVDKDLATFGRLTTSSGSDVFLRNNTSDFLVNGNRDVALKLRQEIVTGTPDLFVKNYESVDNVIFDNTVKTSTIIDTWSVVGFGDIDSMTNGFDGDVYVEFNENMKVYDQKGTIVTSWPTTGVSGARDIAISKNSETSKRIYVLATGEVEAFSVTGGSFGSFLTGSNGQRIASYGDADLYVLDPISDEIRVFDLFGNALTDFPVIETPVDLDIINDRIYVSANSPTAVYVYSLTGTELFNFPVAVFGDSIAVESNGDVYVSDSTQTLKYSSNTGALLDTLPSSSSIRDMTVNNNDDLYKVRDDGSNGEVNRLIYGTELTDNITTETTVNMINSRYLKTVMSSMSSAVHNENMDIFEIFSAEPVAIISTDWSSTVNMLDNDFSTFETVSAINDPTTLRRTVIDFGTVEERIPTLNLQFDTISGSPTYSFDLEVSDDNINYTSVDTGNPSSDVFTQALGASQEFRYMRITMSATGGGVPFESNFNIFEGFDSDVTNPNGVNGLDFSTVKVSGVGQTTIPNTPWTEQVADGQSVLQPPRMFGVLENTNLQMEVLTHRTGQVLTLDRITTRIINRA